MFPSIRRTMVKRREPLFLYSTRDRSLPVQTGVNGEVLSQGRASNLLDKGREQESAYSKGRILLLGVKERLSGSSLRGQLLRVRGLGSADHSPDLALRWAVVSQELGDLHKRISFHSVVR